MFRKQGKRQILRENHPYFARNRRNRALFNDSRNNRKYRDMIKNIDDCINNSNLPITEKDLWEIIAINYSEEWRKARIRLDVAKRALGDITDSPEASPLGTIGSALESHITVPLEENLDVCEEILESINKKLETDIFMIELLEETKSKNYAIITSKDHISRT